MTEETVSEETVASSPQGNEGLIYTGESQELITTQPDDWSYSLDREQYSKALTMGNRVRQCLKQNKKKGLDL